METHVTKRCLSAIGSLLIAGCQSLATSHADTPPQMEQVAPDLTALETIGPGLNHFYFEDWTGPRVPVWVYVPHGVDAKTAPIMVMMHGAKRGAARYLSEWDQIADAHGFIVVAPEFTSDDFPGSAGYNLGNRIPRGSDTVIEEDKWSFSAIERIFDHVVTELDSQQSTYTLYGHSAGSQFAHRFMYFKPDARVNRILAANAGWYTFPDPSIDYPVGLGGLDLNDDDLRRVLERDVVVLLGDQDNDPNHTSLKRDDGVGVQGPHRFARGQNFFSQAKSEADRVGAEFGWRLRIVEGVAHSNGGIAAAAGDLVE
ncbi:MAG: hypothetical protein AAFV37_13720 [Pseudomonadota bacterium]